METETHHHHGRGRSGRRRHHHDDESHTRPGRSGRRGRGRGHGRGRAARGDVRAAVLSLLSEEPMHGYQLMQAISDRTAGRWTPSPGAIYPTISQLEDEGLVTVTAEAGRKLVTLTDHGRERIETAAVNADPFAAFDATDADTDLRPLIEQLQVAVRQVAHVGTDEQRTAAAAVLAQARRSLYLLLADDASAASSEPADLPAEDRMPTNSEL